MAQEELSKGKPKSRPISETRKIRKPLMERKRRERINTSLNELARLLVEAQKVQPEGGKATKLEKADILEHTVRHLQSLQENCQPMKNRNINLESIEDSKIVEEKYHEGFQECIKVVEKALNKSTTEKLRERLLNHLYARFKSLKSARKLTPMNEEVKSKDEENRLSSDEEQNFSSSTSPEEEMEYSKENCSFTLIPTELPDGGVAFLLKGNPQKLLKGWGHLPTGLEVNRNNEDQANTSHSHSVAEIRTEEMTESLKDSCPELIEQENNINSSNHFQNDNCFSTINNNEQSTNTFTSPTPSSSMHSHSKRLKSYSDPKLYFHSPSVQNSSSQNKNHCPPTPPPSPPTDEAPKPHQDAANGNDFSNNSRMVMDYHLVEDRMKMEHDMNEPFDLSLTRMWRPW